MHLDDSYARELEGLYIAIEPEGFPAPEMVVLNRSLARELGLDPETLTADLFTGNRLPAGANPLAMAYAGHQFGGFNPQLGDGRAVLLGELLDPTGRRFDLHLKGSGRTPFSRGGDGKATLGPVLREYILGEAMFHLGIPSTRALAAVTTGEEVWREGRLPGAVLARVATSHLRVGTFEFFAARSEWDKVRMLVEFTLQRHYPEGLQAESPASFLLQAVGRAQAELIARWMHVGFIHGVMNTDNCALSGETIDFGPCAFMDAYDPATVFSSIDHQGRYAYGRQPQIGLWNLTRLADALHPVLDADPARATQLAHDARAAYAEAYDHAYLDGMRRKLGLTGVEDGDLGLLTDLLASMQVHGLDYTQTFRRLAEAQRTPAPSLLFPAAMGPWISRWQKRLGSDGEAADRMDAVNPIYIPRNHKVEEVLAAAVQGDMKPLERLLSVLSAPFTERAEDAAFAGPAPEGFGPYQTFCGT